LARQEAAFTPGRRHRRDRHHIARHAAEGLGLRVARDQAGERRELIWRKAVGRDFGSLASMTTNAPMPVDKPGWFSTLLRVLAKLGVLRYGVKSYTYTSGRDRPPESLMDDVFNADRDLTTAKDVKALLGTAETRKD
jgi:hypothetical protein